MRHERGAAIVVALATFVPVSSHAAEICTARDNAHVDCSGATFNVKVDLSDDATRTGYLGYLNAHYSSKEEVARYIEKTNQYVARVEQLEARARRDRDRVRTMLDELRQEQQASTSLLSSEVDERIGQLEQELQRRDREVKEARTRNRDRDRDLLASLKTIDATLSEHDRRLVEMQEQLERVERQMQEHRERSGYHYNANRHRLRLTGLYAGEVPLARPLDSTFHYEALGGEVSLRTPGLLVASPAFIVPAVSFRRVGGEGAATVTDPGPRPNVLSTTSSWTSTSSILGFDWFLGYEWKAVTLTGKAGVDFVVFEDVRSDEFGSRGGNSTHAYTLGADLFARLVEGFGLHVDVGFWYWDVIQPAGYVYTGPTATVAPAKGVARWDVNASAGVGYAFSL